MATRVERERTKSDDLWQQVLVTKTAPVEQHTAAIAEYMKFVLKREARDA